MNQVPAVPEQTQVQVPKVQTEQQVVFGPVVDQVVSVPEEVTDKQATVGSGGGPHAPSDAEEQMPRHGAKKEIVVTKASKKASKRGKKQSRQAACAEESCAEMKTRSEGDMKGLLGYTDEALVSTDFEPGDGADPVRLERDALLATLELLRATYGEEFFEVAMARPL